MTKLRIGQINMARRRVVADELRAQTARFDLLAVQEPCCKNNQVTGFGMAARVVAQSSGERRPRAAIVILNPSLDVMEMKQHTTADQAACWIRWGDAAFALLSAYMPPKDDIEGNIEHMEAVAQQYGNVLICADTNSWSTAWGSEVTDRRGMKLEDSIARCQLIVVNEPGEPTFVGPRGQSWIDITLASAPMMRRVANWGLRSDTSSDHGTIMLDVVRRKEERRAEGERGYVTRSADWARYRGALEDILVDREWEEPPEDDEARGIENRINVLTGAMRDAAEASLRRRKVRERPVPWWTPTLTALKREYHRARRRCQGCRNEERREVLRLESRRTLKEYRKEMRQRKKSSWDEFVERETEKNPWGIPYRVALDKVKPAQLMAAMRVGGRQAETLEEAVAMYVDHTYPRDDPTLDTEEDRMIRRTTEYPPGTDLCEPWDIWDLRLAIEKQKVGRAPGLDEIDAAILRNSAPQIEDELLAICNLCLDRGHFPYQWKEADLRLLYKGGGKDKEQPKAYRPICLLPVISKVLEHLIMERMKPVLRVAGHPRQFGSTKGKGTADALMQMKRDVEDAEEKYALLILFDISSAFDSVWWPVVMQRLQEYDAPSNLYSLVGSYLKDRRVKIRGNSFEVERGIERGCPQGSVLGPALWKLVFDQLLGELEEKGYRAIAYVDDLAVLVTANSRARVKEEAEGLAILVEEWCQKRKLRMAAEKTQAMLLKGKTDRAHPINLDIGGARVRACEEVTYLGVRFRRSFDPSPHIAYLRGRVTTTLNGLSRIGSAFWGVKYPATRTIYKGVVLGIIRYASPAWSRRLTKEQRGKLATTQRLALLRVTKAYRTVSHEAVQILAGEMPIDLILKEDVIRFDVKRHGLGSLPEGLRQRAEEEPGRWKRLVEEDSLREWNERWVRSEKGSTLRKYFPTVSSRMEAKWVRPDYWTSQILTGHGGFRDKLNKHGKNINPLCPTCGIPDTAEHVVLSCEKMAGHRAWLSRMTGLYAMEEADLPRLMSEDFYPYFTEYIRRWKEAVGPEHFTLGRGRPPEAVEEATEEEEEEREGAVPS